jgi:hypothetical protein
MEPDNPAIEGGEALGRLAFLLLRSGCGLLRISYAD